MNNTYYIRCSCIKDEEWYLLESLPKSPSCTLIPALGKYFTISDDGVLLSRYVPPTNSTRIDNLPDFIQKLNEIRLFLLL